MLLLNFNLPLLLGLAVAWGVVACAMLAANRRRAAAVRRLVGVELAPRLADSLDWHRRYWRQALGLAALLFLAGALLRPALDAPAGAAGKPRRAAGVLLILDCSQSMLATDMPGKVSRLDAARAWIRTAVAATPQYSYAILTFAGEAFLHCPFTNDPATLDLFLKNADTSLPPVQGSDLPAALRAAADILNSRAAAADRLAVILLSDGGDPDDDPQHVACELATGLPAPLHAVGFGSPAPAAVRLADGTPLRDAAGNQVLVALNEPYLAALAKAGNGVYVRAAGGAPLAAPETLAALAGGGSDPAVAAALTAAGRRELYAWPLAAALVCLLAMLLTGERRRQAPGASSLAALALLLPVIGVAAVQAGPVTPPRFLDIIAGQQGGAAVEPQPAPVAPLTSTGSPETVAAGFLKLGMRQEAGGDTAGAAAAYARVLELEKAPPELRAAAALNLGGIRHRAARAQIAAAAAESLRDFAAAQDLYLLSLRLQPEQPPAAVNLELLGRDRALAELYLEYSRDHAVILAAARNAVATALAASAVLTAEGPTPSQKVWHAVDRCQEANLAVAALFGVPVPVAGRDNSMLMLLFGEASSELAGAEKNLARVLVFDPPIAERRQFFAVAAAHLRNAAVLLGVTWQQAPDQQPAQASAPVAGHAGGEAQAGGGSAESANQAAVQPAAGAAAPAAAAGQLLNRQQAEAAFEAMAASERDLDERLRSRRLRFRRPENGKNW